MQRVKIFKALENEHDVLELQINQWIAATNARILHISGNIAPQTESGRSGGLASTGNASDVLVIVLYELPS
jgi:hypothetical protein